MMIWDNRLWISKIWSWDSCLYKHKLHLNNLSPVQHRPNNNPLQLSSPKSNHLHNNKHNKEEENDLNDYVNYYDFISL